MTSTPPKYVLHEASSTMRNIAIGILKGTNNCNHYGNEMCLRHNTTLWNYINHATKEQKEALLEKIHQENA